MLSITDGDGEHGEERLHLAQDGGETESVLTEEDEHERRQRMTRLLSQIAHLEVSSPDVAASVDFYTTRFGMRVVDELDGKVYLRAWGDYYRYSLIVAPGDEPSLVAMAWRTESAEALEQAVSNVEASGISGTWSAGGPGHGRSYDFVGPYGHGTRLVWDLPQYEAPDELSSSWVDRPERRSSHAGAPRFFDHVTVASRDVRGMADWYSEVLGFRIMAFTDLDEAPITIFSVLTTNEKSHDLGIVIDTSDRAGRVNHVAFWLDTHEELLIAADVLMENGIPIEYGPSIHGVGEQNYLYFREPSGLRIELNSGGYRNYVPDWKPKVWLPSTGSASIYRNSAMPMSMTESFPYAVGGTGTEEGVADEIKEALLSPLGKPGQG
jgi:catechol 2,3-dioxygenase